MNILVLDTETTGFPKRDAPIEDQPWLVQFAAVLADEEGRELGVLSKMIKPDGYEIPEKATNIHGITTEMAREVGFSLLNVMEDVERMVANAEVIIGHNIGFDMKMLNLAFEHLGLTAPWAPNFPTFCTMKSTTNVLKLPQKNGGYKWPTLGEAYQHFTGKPLEGAHDAMADVRATMDIYKALMAGKES